MNLTLCVKIQEIVKHLENMNTLSWSQVTESLQDMGALESASNLHGYIVGRAVAGHALFGNAGLRMIADGLSMDIADIKAEKEEFEPILESVNRCFIDDIFDFRLLLPDDDNALSVRLAALGDWTQSFLSGMGSTMGLRESGIDKTEADTLRDLSEIAQISDDIDESEENEALYVELTEYVRLSTLNLFDRFQEFSQHELDDAEDQDIPRH